jgi:hypothetical protein
MNTISLVLNGRTAADITMLPERQRATLTTIYARQLSSSSMPPTPSLSGRSTPSSPPKRPQQHKRQYSRDSPGWYNTEGGMTLDDFAKRLNTNISKFEQWQGRCAQNVVMALMRPTPMVLFLFNPISLFIWILVALCWISVKMSGSGVSEGLK